MAEIYITPDVLRDASAKLASAQAEQENALSTIQGVVDEILANWEGKAKEAFMAAWEEKKGTYKEFGVDMSQFSDFLRTYSNTMEDIDVGEGQKISGV